MRNKSWILCASLLVLGAGLAEAQTCPCWSAEELAAVVPALCQNELDLNNAALESCTSINGDPSLCNFGVPENGWVLTWQGLIQAGFQGPGCYWQHGAASRLFCQNCGAANTITTAEVLSCALEIAAFGETVENPTCVVDGTPCDADADCFSMCSFDGTNCQQDADCHCREDPRTQCRFLSCPGQWPR